MEKLNKVLSKIEYWFLGVGIILIAVILGINVIMRYVFSTGFTWAEEAARYIMVWITFVGASVCAYKGGNISIDSIMGILSERGKKILTIITIIVSIVFLAIFSYLSAKLTVQALQTNQLTPAMDIPMFFVYLSMPAGGILIIYRNIQQLLNTLKSD